MPSKWIAISCIALLWACKSHKTVTTIPSKDLSFGEGGGFTGAVQTWVLRSNGRIDSAVQDSLVFTGRSIPASEAAELIKEAETLLSEARKTEAGNYYYFLSVSGQEIPLSAYFMEEETGYMSMYRRLQRRCLGR